MFERVVICSGGSLRGGTLLARCRSGLRTASQPRRLLGSGQVTSVLYGCNSVLYFLYS